MKVEATFETCDGTSISFEALGMIYQYQKELISALNWKLDGQRTVSADTAGEELANSREEVPIEEYIESWKKGIKEMEEGADPEKYNY